MPLHTQRGRVSKHTKTQAYKGQLVLSTNVYEKSCEILYTHKFHHIIQISHMLTDTEEHKYPEAHIYYSYNGGEWSYMVLMV